mmetsp:Transcript_49539/g.127794  ORF Transcript_49539/g.127794 Transcript_49539/m.127794 type:complete len:341 (-) Transcript_49539:89-1111(-)
MRRGPFAPLVRGLAVRPGVEDLNALRTALHLEDGILRDGGCDSTEKLLDHSGLLVHPLPELLRILGAPALDRIGGQCPGSTDEPEQGAVTLGLLPKGLQGLSNEAVTREEVIAVHHLADGVGACEPVLKHAREVPEHEGAPAADDVELDAHRRERRQDVGEEDDGVHAVAPPALQREFDRDLGGLRALPEGVALGVLPKGLHVASCLSHQPHRCPVTTLTSGDAEEEIRRRGGAARLRIGRNCLLLLHHRNSQRGLQARGRSLAPLGGGCASQAGGRSARGGSPRCPAGAAAPGAEALLWRGWQQKTGARRSNSAQARWERSRGLPRQECSAAAGRGPHC